MQRQSKALDVNYGHQTVLRLCIAAQLRRYPEARWNRWDIKVA
jgi:hypothetical protein